MTFEMISKKAQVSSSAFHCVKVSPHIFFGPHPTGNPGNLKAFWWCTISNGRPAVVFFSLPLGALPLQTLAAPWHQPPPWHQPGARLDSVCPHLMWWGGKVGLNEYTHATGEAQKPYEAVWKLNLQDFCSVCSKIFIYTRQSCCFDKHGSNHKSKHLQKNSLLTEGWL